MKRAPVLNAPPQLQRAAELNVALLKVDKQKVPRLRGLKRSMRLIGGQRGSLSLTGTFHSRFFISPSSTWRWRRHRPWFCLLWSTYFYVLTSLPSLPSPPPIEQMNQSVEGQNKSENSLNRMICSACETLGYSIIFGPTYILYLIDGAELSLVFWVFLRHWKFSCIRKLNLQSGRKESITSISQQHATSPFKTKE